MAKTKEQLAWDNFKPDMAGRFFFRRVENQIGEAMSDVIAKNLMGTVFWLELKALHEWPKRGTTIPLKGAFEKGQIPFMRAWIGPNRFGHAFVLLRVTGIFYLLDPMLELREQTVVEVIENAKVVGKSAIIDYLENL